MQREMSLLIKPVGAECNLRCGYCFYLRASGLYPESHGPMADEVLEAMISKFLALRQPQSGLSWQGGEPTTAGLDFFRKVIELEQRFGRPGQSVANSLQTNGVLIDDDWAGFLKRWNFLVGVSIDGPPEVHEVFRGNTLERAVLGAKTLMRRGVPTNVLSVISSASAGKAAAVYRYLRALGFSFLQFIPCVEKDPGTGRMRDCSVRPEDYGEFMCAVFDLWREEPPGTVSVRDFEALAAAALGVPRPLCTFKRECADYLLVERTGDVYPCDFFAYPEWRLGNVVTDDFEALASSGLRRRFASGKASSSPECSACRWVELCSGGCMKDRPGFPAHAAEKTHLCEGYKMFFEHAFGYFESFAGERRRDIGAARRGQGTARVGPNDRCPCGSGKKFKHCCGRTGR